MDGYQVIIIITIFLIEISVWDKDFPSLTK